MMFASLLKSLLKAPILAAICAVLGLMFSALLVLASFLIHLFAVMEEGQTSLIVNDALENALRSTG